MSILTHGEAAAQQVGDLQMKQSTEKPLEIIVTHSVDETVTWGRSFASRLCAGDVLALHGELGAGKTCLTKGIAAGLGVAASVTSPTFTLVHEYAGRVPVFHIDLYRLNSVAEAVGAGVPEYLGDDGICIIEWAEKISELLPSGTWRVDIDIVSAQERRITVLKEGRKAP
jgi:tRNA threonylcarbamoyladenosine biosynthesis protein TsaE